MAEPDSSRGTKESFAQLLSLAVHEFRTPLSVLGGYLRMLQRDGEPSLGPHQKKFIDEAERSCLRLSALVAELSEISKLDAGTATVQEEDFDLFSTLASVAAGVHEAEDRDVKLALRGLGEGAPIRGDHARVKAAFTSCFRAVLREQPASCTVVAERRLEQDGHRTSAITIVAEESLVESAYTAPQTRLDEQRGGLGLLLPIARRVIEREGGRLWAPAPPGPAVAIIVSLPLGRPKNTSPEPDR